MMGKWLDTLQTLEAAGTPAVLVTLLAVRGSTPREAGCKMVVTDAGTDGTIGGGNLEFQSIAAARALLTEQGTAPVLREFPLGPALGQCCGGHATVLFEVMRPVAWHVALFGAGHVGRALVTLLGTLDCRVSWIDPRRDVFPSDVPANVACVRDEAPAGVAAALRPGSYVLVMTHDHGLDFEIVATALPRADLPFIGLIGSETKRARFVGRLARSGLSPEAIRRLVCPIGLPGAGGKMPVEIAIAAAAQLLQVRDAVAPVAAPPARARPVSLVACADCGAAGCGQAPGVVAR